MAAMVPLDQAKALALEIIEIGNPIQVALGAAHGRFLAEPVRAPRSLPNFDNSAMDGYALQSADTSGANRDRPARMRVVETIYAGALPQRSIGGAQAARIFTGAPVPKGADCVVRQEATRAEGDDHVLIFVEAARNSNIRREGGELPQGERVFSPGQRLDAYALALLASLGLDRVAVRPQPTVSILTLGDELVPPGSPAAGHQIYNSNAALLRALCVESGARVVLSAHEGDQEAALRTALEKLAPSADLLITAGGASVGDKDLVKRVLRALGAVTVFDGVALKPGKPAGVLMFDKHPILILPGNPGAAAVAFDQFARPMLLKRQGVTEVRKTIRVGLGSPQHKQAGLTYLLSAKLRQDDDGRRPTATIRPQGSGQLLQIVGADGWVVLPPGRAEFAAGEEAAMELFARSTFSAVPPVREETTTDGRSASR
jgi:molybdopterin molybdotransferase